MSQEKTKFENFPCQELYGNFLEKATNFALLVLAVTFGLYIFGILDPYIPTDQLVQVWSLPLHDFNQTVNAPQGWGWVQHIAQADYLNYVGIVILAGVTGVCYLLMLFKATCEKKLIFSVMLVIELGLIGLAASNILSVGGH